MSTLPEGWAEAKLLSLGEWGSGGTPLRSNRAFFENATIPWLKIGDLNDGVVTCAEESITQTGLEQSSAKLVPPGTLLVAMYGSIGKLGITGIQCATNQAIAFCKPFVDKKYLFWILKANRELLCDAGKGGTQANISQAVLRNFVVPLPPFAEQRRIVEKVEALLAPIATATRKVQSVTSTIVRIRRSILDAAYDGSLAATAATTFTPFGDITVDLRGGNSTTSVRGETNWPVLKSSAVRPFEIDFTNLNFLMRADDCVPSAEVREGDLLITRLSGSIDFVGNCALVETRPTGTLQIPDRIFRARVSEDFDPRFIEIVFNAPRARKPLEEAAKSSAGHQRISLSNIREVAIPRFPRVEQARIVDRFSAIMREITAVERRLRLASQSAEALTNAILAKAFAGELVPTEAELARREGRSYEPAPLLLDRIRSEREQADSKPKRRGRWIATSASRGARSPRR